MDASAGNAKVRPCIHWHPTQILIIDKAYLPLVWARPIEHLHRSRLSRLLNGGALTSGQVVIVLYIQNQVTLLPGQAHLYWDNTRIRALCHLITVHHRRELDILPDTLEHGLVHSCAERLRTMSGSVRHRAITLKTQR